MKTYKKSFVTKKWNILIQKILHFISISVKCILWQIFNEIVDNQDLCWNEDDFRNFFKTKKFLFYKLISKSIYILPGIYTLHIDR